MKTKIIAIILIVFFFAGVIGCASYYQVKDPDSGSLYYTTDIDTERGGAIKFKDAKTDSQVTLQSSEVKEITSDEYKKAVEGKD